MTYSIKSKICSSLSHLSSSHPISIIISVIIIDIIVSIIVASKLSNVSFDEPLRGFESRGSNLATRINTWKLITGRVHSDIDQRLSFSPQNEEIIPSTESTLSHDAIDMEEEEEKKRLAGIRASIKAKPKIRGKKLFFCGQLTDNYVQLVIGKNLAPHNLAPQILAPNFDDLFTISNLKLICDLDAKIRNSVLDSHTCAMDESDANHSCCKSWTLPNMIAAIKNRTDCDQITSEDVTSVKSLLSRCYPDYKRHLLHENCAEEPKTCPVVPEECRDANYVYETLHFLLDSDFVDTLSGSESNSNAHAHLKKSNIFLPIAKSSTLSNLYSKLEYFLGAKNGSYQVSVSSMDLGMRDAMFESLLVNDSRLLLIALMTVSLIIWIQTRSFLVLMITSLNLIASFGITSLIYEYIFLIPFFPFMNILSIILLIAVGSDNTLIYSKIWRIETLSKHPLPVEDVVKSTLERTVAATSITSLTTALALSASVCSDITSIKCFSIFSATCILTQHALTTISLPSALIISSDKELFGSFSSFGAKSLKYEFLSKFSSAFQSMARDADKIINKIFLNIFNIISICKYFIAIFLILLSIAFTFVFLTYLKLPSSEHIATFSDHHPFEIFESIDRNYFKFCQKMEAKSGKISTGKNIEDARNSETNIQELSKEEIPITFIFGANPIDNGFKLDPDDRGSLELDDKFHPEDQEIQVWMLNFCESLKRSPFYRPIHGPLLSNCFIETLKGWIEERDCYDEVLNLSNDPCCKKSTFPFAPATFNACVKQATDMLIRTPTYIISRDAPGVRFDRKTSKVALVIIQFMTNLTLSNSHEEMRKTLNLIDDWFREQLVMAPNLNNERLINGWFILNHLELFSLQESLASGVYISVAIALFLTLISVSLITSNAYLTIATLSSVASIITSTLAILSYFFHWEINVVESVVILVAIGMSVDLPLHLAMAFREQEDGLRNRTLTSLNEVASPLFSASLTTIMAGVSLINSSILAYQKVAAFLIVIPSMNLLFTFLLLPVSIY